MFDFENLDVYKKAKIFTSDIRKFIKATAFYSLLIAFTGFSRAALMACELIVNKAMTRAAIPDSKIVSGFTSI